MNHLNTLQNIVGLGEPWDLLESCRKLFSKIWNFYRNHKMFNRIPEFPISCHNRIERRLPHLSNFNFVRTRLQERNLDEVRRNYVQRRPVSIHSIWFNVPENIDTRFLNIWNFYSIESKILNVKMFRHFLFARLKRHTRNLWKFEFIFVDCALCMRSLRTVLCGFFQDKKVKVSLFLQDQRQFNDGSLAVQEIY